MQDTYIKYFKNVQFTPLHVFYFVSILHRSELTRIEGSVLSNVFFTSMNVIRFIRLN